MVKYEATITAVGPLTSEFIDHGIIVLFGSDAPEELQEFALIHDGEKLEAPLQAGDKVSIDNHSFKVLAVGDVANDNLNNLGHLVLKFNGENEVEMPGDVCIEAADLPPIVVGTKLHIEG